METIVLADGIRLHHFKEERFKSEYLSANLICPPVVTHGAHSVLLSSLMGQSNARYPKNAAFSRALETAYNTSFSAKMFRIGETRIHPFAVSWLSERYVQDGFRTMDFALDFMATTLFEPHLEKGVFPNGELQKQIKNRIDDLAAEKNNKQRYALKQCVRELCKGEPFAIPLGSTVKDLQQVSPDSLYEYYCNLLKKAPVEFYYFGRTPAEELKERLLGLFEPLFTPKDSPAKELVSRPKDIPSVITEEAAVSQSTLCIGFKTDVTLPHPLHPAQVVMKEILSDSPVSLLFTNVREKESLC